MAILQKYEQGLALALSQARRVVRITRGGRNICLSQFHVSSMEICDGKTRVEEFVSEINRVMLDVLGVGGVRSVWLRGIFYITMSIETRALVLGLCERRGHLSSSSFLTGKLKGGTVAIAATDLVFVLRQYITTVVMDYMVAYGTVVGARTGSLSCDHDRTGDDLTGAMDCSCATFLEALGVDPGDALSSYDDYEGGPLHYDVLPEGCFSKVSGADAKLMVNLISDTCDNYGRSVHKNCCRHYGPTQLNIYEDYWFPSLRRGFLS